ncbi:ubiquitin C-terminal hydrolase 12-like [Cryptomeria japonica]|uniref:ubiquitin C-terminal hydrolase 12-like n=1 Tax=Cryptomeria japonica TaxID=3369 RepID=UPI0027D9EEC5|nr:ubiquitin C-terminal hydrolase 12-like [Cryptomeria japonica]
MRLSSGLGFCHSFMIQERLQTHFILCLSQLDSASIKAASAIGNQTYEYAPAFRYTWMIDNFSSLNVKRHYSDVFTIEGLKWRLRIFPKGNRFLDQLALFLDAADAATLSNGWSRRVKFSLTVINQMNSTLSKRRGTCYEFNSRVTVWGCLSVMPLKELYDPSNGYLVNDTLIVEANVVIQKV